MPMDEGTIARRVKEFRRSKGLSLEKLAGLTGFTKGYLSRIENSTKAPPIFTLSRISQALEIDINRFFSDGHETSEAKTIAVSRRGDRIRTNGRGTPYGYVYEALAPDKAGKNMEPYVIYVGAEKRASFQHEGEELLYVLEGKLEFFFGDDAYMLEEGDSLYFDSNVPHSGRSIGKKAARLLVTIYSYKRL
jgi:transcriptional regulator with XRE-family HTH domain